MLQLLPVYFPLFGTPVLKPDLHLKPRYTLALDINSSFIFTSSYPASPTSIFVWSFLSYPELLCCPVCTQLWALQAEWTARKTNINNNSIIRAKVMFKPLTCMQIVLFSDITLGFIERFLLFLLQQVSLKGLLKNWLCCISSTWRNCVHLTTMIKYVHNFYFSPSPPHTNMKTEIKQINQNKPVCF